MVLEVLGIGGTDLSGLLRLRPERSYDSISSFQVSCEAKSLVELISKALNLLKSSS